MLAYTKGISQTDSNFVENIFQRAKYVSHHVAHRLLSDEKTILSVVQEAMVQVSLHRKYIEATNYFKVKSFVAIITEQVALRTLRDKKERAGHDVDFKSFSGDENMGSVEQMGRLKAIDALSMRDRNILLLFAVHHLSISQIALLLRMNSKSVDKRFSRAVAFVNRPLFDADVTWKNLSEEQRHDTVESIKIWQHRNLNRIEAFAHVDPYPFSSAFEKETMEKMKKANHTGNFSFSQLSGQKLRAPLIVFASALLIFLFVLWLKPKESKAPLEKGGVENEQREEENSQKLFLLAAASSGAKGGLDLEHLEKVVATRTISSDFYSSYPGTLLFIDPKTQALYELSAGAPARKVIDLSSLLEEQGEVQDMGKVEDDIYLALYTGKGAKISGNPAKIEIQPYWYDAWFEGKTELSAQLKSGIVIDNVLYLFEATGEVE